MSLIKHNIGISIKKARKIKKISQTKLAVKLGVSRHYLSAVENDKRNLSMDLLKNISHKLEIPIAFILLLGLNEDCFRKKHKIKLNVIKTDMESMIENIFNDKS